MRIGAFELNDPLPDLKDAQVFSTLAPWVDVGGVGSLTLYTLEASFGAQELGKLWRPGMFYDFTRYRPTASSVEGRRNIRIPNTFVNYAHRKEGDIVFLHTLEPHNMGETYVESTLKMLERLGVKRYCLIGGMYDSVPHTRPLIVSGTASDSAMQRRLAEVNVNASGYQGPSTINILLLDQAPKAGIETMTLIVHLPYYAQLEQDFAGQYTLLSLISHLFSLSVDIEGIQHQGDEQYQRITQAMESNPEVKKIVQAAEKNYDEGLEERKPPDTRRRLSPEVESFLKEVEKRLDSSE